MKKILYKTIACLLIPSFVFAQPYPYRSNEKSIQQTDLSRLWNALNTDVGQQIISYIETIVGSINLEQAKAFSINKGEAAFVPIKSFRKELAALCYRQLDDGTEYLFLITYNATEKDVSFTFSSGRMYSMKAAGIEESINPDFQFQQYDDLRNTLSINAAGADLSKLIQIVCLPYCGLISSLILLIRFMSLLFCGGPGASGCNLFLVGIAALIAYLVPVLLIFTIYAAYPSKSDLKLSSILFALYYYSCISLDGHKFDYTCKDR